MAQEGTQTNQFTTAQRDAKFIAEHPVEGRVVQLGAGMAGVGEAAIHSIEETAQLAKKTYEPGDQKHIRHPIDEFSADMVKLKNGISALTQAGDMRIDHSPHPVDQAVLAASAKLQEMQQAGAIEGVRIGAAATVGPILDTLGPGGKLKTAENVLDDIADASKVARAVNHVNDAATNAFLHKATLSMEKQLVDAMGEYERTARAAKTYGDELGRYEGHGDALVRFEIASIKLNALKHGEDASINNPVIADLTKKGIESEHFYSTNIMNELRKFNPNQSQDYEKIAADIASDATKDAHENRLNYLLQLQKDNKTLTVPQMAEIGVGLQYGPDAAANARELIKNNQRSTVTELYPNKVSSAEGALVKPDVSKQEVAKPNDHVSFNDAINHLEQAEAKTIVLARIEEQKEHASQHQMSVELT